MSSYGALIISGTHTGASTTPIAVEYHNDGESTTHAMVLHATFVVRRQDTYQTVDLGGVRLTVHDHVGIPRRCLQGFLICPGYLRGTTLADFQPCVTGKVAGRESPRVAAAREIHEEMGLFINPAALEQVFTDARTIDSMDCEVTTFVLDLDRAIATRRLRTSVPSARRAGRDDRARRVCVYIRSSRASIESVLTRQRPVLIARDGRQSIPDQAGERIVIIQAATVSQILGSVGLLM